MNRNERLRPGQEPACWNHNTAYYGWLRRETAACRTILDVGCGNGMLCAFLHDGTKALVGIDPDQHCILAAQRLVGSNAAFHCADFLTHDFDGTFDSVIFVASLHHMDMEQAIRKAKRLLNPGGRLLIVGLAKPSSIPDHIIEALRVLPCAVISRAKHMAASEALNIPVSYDFPAMRDVRAMARKLLPGAKLRYGLYYRYLLSWEAPYV